VVTNLSTLADLEKEHIKFKKEVEPKIGIFEKNGYMPQAKETAQKLNKIPRIRDLGYITFAKEVFSMRFPMMIIAFLRDKKAQNICNVTDEDSLSQLERIEKGVSWNNPQFTAITAEKPRMSIIIQLLKVTKHNKKVEAKVAEWHEIYTVLHDISVP